MFSLMQPGLANNACHCPSILWEQHPVLSEAKASFLLQYTCQQHRDSQHGPGKGTGRWGRGLGPGVLVRFCLLLPKATWSLGMLRGERVATCCSFPSSRRVFVRASKCLAAISSAQEAQVAVKSRFEGPGHSLLMLN